MLRVAVVCSLGSPLPPGYRRVWTRLRHCDAAIRTAAPGPGASSRRIGCGCGSSFDSSASCSAVGAIVFLVGAAALRLLLWQYSQGPAGLRAARQLRAAGDDPRPCGRRQPARRICPRAAAVPADPGGAEAGDRAPSSRPRTRTSTRHAGIDPEGIVRAVVANSASRRPAPSRAPRPSPSRSRRTSCSATSRPIERKIREALIALRIEATFSKDKILELYLNEIYLGPRRNYGVAAAALNYFGKSVHELTLAEAAYLAACRRRRTTTTRSASAEARDRRGATG